MYRIQQLTKTEGSSLDFEKVAERVQNVFLTEMRRAYTMQRMKKAPMVKLEPIEIEDLYDKVQKPATTPVKSTR